MNAPKLPGGLAGIGAEVETSNLPYMMSSSGYIANPNYVAPVAPVAGAGGGEIGMMAA